MLTFNSEHGKCPENNKMNKQQIMNDAIRHEVEVIFSPNYCFEALKKPILKRQESLFLACGSQEFSFHAFSIVCLLSIPSKKIPYLQV